MTSSVSLVFLRPWSVRVWGDQITGLKDSSQPKLQVIGRFLGLGSEGNQTKSLPYSQTSSKEVCAGRSRDGESGTGCLTGFWQLPVSFVTLTLPLPSLHLPPAWRLS